MQARVWVIFALWAACSVALAGNDLIFADGFEGSAVVVSCGPQRPPVADRCEVTAGTAFRTIRSHFASPDQLFLNAEVLIDDSGAIRCAACDCSSEPGYAGATVLNCPEVLTTPGLINTHDHVTFQSPAVDHGAERFDHRHDWRRGVRAHSQVAVASTPGSEPTTWGELRQLLGGATSISGSGGVSGFVRNLDRSTLREGLNGPSIDYDTFPLGDADGTLRESGCAYPSSPSPGSGEVYQPHLAVGIDQAARNEWTCAAPELPAADGGLPGPFLVHAIGMTPAEVSELAAIGGSVSWSPRSDLSLYGMTTPVSLMRRLGVRVALGTDWNATGSMNMLREFACAADYSETSLNGLLGDQELLIMATRSAAEAGGVSDQIGQVATGYLADLTLFDASERSGYAAAIGASSQDVVLVLRGGTPLLGDDAVMSALGAGEGVCDLMGDVVAGDCMSGHRICVMRDAGTTYAQLYSTYNASLTALYTCDVVPAGERTCVPARDEGDGISYSGIPTQQDPDADGVATPADNCGATFNPPRPVDGFAQGDADADGVGDSCDASPL